MSFIRPVLTALASFQEQQANVEPGVAPTARECTVALEKIFNVGPSTPGENLLKRAGRVVQLDCRQAQQEGTLQKCINMQSRLRTVLDVPPEDYGYFPSAVDPEILGLRLLHKF